MILLWGIQFRWGQILYHEIQWRTLRMIIRKLVNLDKSSFHVTDSIMLSKTWGFFGGVRDTNLVFIFKVANKPECVLKQFAHEEGTDIWDVEAQRNLQPWQRFPRRSLRPRRDSNNAASHLGTTSHNRACTMRSVTTDESAIRKSARRNQQGFWQRVMAEIGDEFEDDKATRLHGLRS